MKIALEGFKSRRKNEETLQQKNLNYPYWEAERKIKGKKNLKILRNLYNTAEHTNMHEMRVPKDGRNRGTKAYLKK